MAATRVSASVNCIEDNKKEPDNSRAKLVEDRLLPEADPKNAGFLRPVPNLDY